MRGAPPDLATGNFTYAVYSDARSAQIVDDRIRPALESGSKVGSNKPTLLVVDEIDGATGGSDTVRSLGVLVAYRQLIVW